MRNGDRGILNQSDKQKKQKTKNKKQKKKNDLNDEYAYSKSQFIYMIKIGRFVCPDVCLFVCVHPSSAHSFSPIGMKLGMDTPWDPGSDMG